MQSRTWRVRPRNLVAHGIHSDEEARKIGFAGGFVPGVTLYELVVAELLRQGIDWLRTGSAEFRFRKPVYDNEEVEISIDGPAGTFEVRSPDGGEVRASGRLGLDEPPPAVARRDPVTPEPEPLGNPAQTGLPLSITVPSDAERAALAEAVPEGFRFREDGRALYPVGLWQNPVDMLKQHYTSPVTVHYWGRVWHHSPVYTGETIVKRGAITGFLDRNGNDIVAYTVAVETEDGRPVATIEHQSVYALARAKAVGR
jgi:hypothetical protein